MRVEFFCLIAAALALGACASNVAESGYELTVVDAATMTPVSGLDLVVDYGFGEVLFPPPQVQGRTGDDGKVRIDIAEWGVTLVQAGGTRYRTHSCDTAPRGWLHPEGAEYTEVMPGVDPAHLFIVEHPAPFQPSNNAGRSIPAGTPGVPPVAIHVRPLNLSEAQWMRSVGNCTFSPLFPAP